MTLPAHHPGNKDPVVDVPSIPIFIPILWALAWTFALLIAWTFVWSRLFRSIPLPAARRPLRRVLPQPSQPSAAESCSFRRLSPKRRLTTKLSACAVALVTVLVGVSALPLGAQTVPGPGTVVTPAQPSGQQPGQDTKITRQQAKELFSSVNEILQFASDDSKLAIHRQVKRRLINREQVEKYILDRFHDDKDAAHMQREEIVLKKFGLLDRDFQLQPFLVSLLKEQIAGFYDNKTKTVNLLDWVAPDEQKPVMAHELTHALQDQHTDLEKWEPDQPESVAGDVAEDNHRLAEDERDTARDAVLEGQAMAVYVDYTLKPAGKSLLTSPNIIDTLNDDSDVSDGSPVMARAPLLLKESLLFPYRDGLAFEQTLLKDKGPQYAFAGVLDRPPSTSYEIMNPHAYEEQRKIPLLRMPDVHALLNADYRPYDIGVMGELDVRILTELFGGPAEAAVLTPQWAGGLYYAAQKKSAVTPQDRASTASLGLLYLSAWKSEGAAEEFVRVYVRELNQKYSGVTRDTGSESSADEQVYNTNEGPVLVVRQASQVFVSEGFDLTLARKLQFLLLGAQQDGENEVTAHATLPHGWAADGPAERLARWMGSYGVMKAALRP